MGDGIGMEASMAITGNITIGATGVTDSAYTGAFATARTDIITSRITTGIPTGIMDTATMAIRTGDIGDTELLPCAASALQA
jgi:hypothetical protein